LKIVSYIPESFLEYEDYISLVLFCYGCNMICDFCYNYNFISSPQNIINESVESIIDRNVTSLTDGLVFLGGEPTQYKKELYEISYYVKKQYNLSVKLFSNGTNLDIVTYGVKNGFFDSVSLDFKSNKKTESIFYNKDWNQYVLGMVKVIKQFDRNNWNDKLEIRTTVFPEIEEQIVEIGNFCDTYNIKHIVQRDVRSSYNQIGVI
jgi:pyruvate formate lyase activating enzyme